MRDWKKLLAFAGMAAGVTAIDHAGKLVAAKYLADGTRYSFLADTFRLEATFNTGAILGLGSQLPEGIRAWMLPAVTAAVLVWVSILVIRERESSAAFTGLSLVWAGGFSNLVDRLAYGKVFDFFNLGIGVIRTGTANLADVAIMIGIPLLLIGWWRMKSVSRDELPISTV